MPVSDSPLAYDDVQAYLDRAMAAERGIQVSTASREDATRLRHRANRFRQIDRNRNKSIYEPGHPMFGNSVYDKIMMQIRTEGTAHFLVLRKIVEGDREVSEL